LRRRWRDEAPREVEILSGCVADLPQMI
jgi:hypothetical protein